MRLRSSPLIEFENINNRNCESPAATRKSLIDYIEITLRRWKLVFGVFFGVMIVAVIIALISDSFYTSSAKIEVEQKQSKLNDNVYGNPDYVEFKNYLVTQEQIFKSESLADDLMRRMHLEESTEFNKNSPTVVSRFFSWIVRSAPSRVTEADGSASTPTSLKDDTIVRQIVDRISVRQIKNSNLLAVRIDAKDPKLAKEMLQNLLALYLKNNLDHRRKESLEAAGWLQAEAAKSESKLLEAQLALVNFSIDNGLVDSMDGGMNQVVNVLNKTMEGRIKSQQTRAKIEALRAHGVPITGNSLPETMKNEYTDKLKRDLAALESEYSQKSIIYSANFPILTMLDNRIKTLRDQIVKTNETEVSSALNAARDEDRLLKQDYDHAKKEADRIKSLEAQYSVLRKKVDTNSEIHKILLTEFKQMEIRARTTSNNIRIVDRPTYPTKPSRPLKGLLLLFASVAGLCWGVVAAIVAENLDNTIRNPRKLQPILGTMSLWIVPDARKISEMKGLPVKRGDLDLFAYQYPKSPMGDAIRNMQTAITSAGLKKRVTSLAVSSSTHGEGKTLIAISIASVLSRNGRKQVIVIDCDMRKPRLHSAFGSNEPGRGLSKCLDGTIDDVSTVIRSSGIGGLSYISSGQLPRDPVALLQSERMGKLIEELENSFDYVVLDTPPILGYADTPILCPLVHGLVMVAKQGHVGLEELKDAIDVIHSSNGCRIFGVALNKVNSNRIGGRWLSMPGHCCDSYYRYESTVDFEPAVRTIKSKEFLNDVRLGMSKDDLMTKYGLSPQGFRQITKSFIDHWSKADFSRDDRMS